MNTEQETTLYICAPQATAKTVHAGECGDCGKRSRFLSFFTPWYGYDSTCISCGRNWCDGEWMPLSFVRQSRQKSIKRAKDRWRRMPDVVANHYGLNKERTT